MFDDSQEQQCQVGAAPLVEFIFGGAPRVPSRDFLGENLRSSFICCDGNYLAEGIVLRVWTSPE